MTALAAILSVSQLNRQIKGFLEQEIGIIHVEGEISNLSKPSSGHFYFTLKDSTAQIRCVFFKNRHSTSPAHTLRDGQNIIAGGRLSLYEARGDYQLIVDEVTEGGIGAFYQRFEALKKKLAAEGLFNPERKKPIPKIPKSIGIITSSTGAALRDILSTLARRFPVAKVFIYPSDVQGAAASQQLIKALQAANAHSCCDVLILARGGGSIEDLWPFNEEELARQIALSHIPIVSGVGHETDYTIADFVADYRAETPTAAAAAVTPNNVELINGLNNAIARLHHAVMQCMHTHQIKLKHLFDKIASPKQTVAVYWQTLDYMERQLVSSMNRIMVQKRHQVHAYLNQLKANNPKTQMAHRQVRVEQLVTLLTQQMQIKVSQLRAQMSGIFATLHALSPLATLDRGYAIAICSDKVLHSATEVAIGDPVEVRLAKGVLTCKVLKIRL